MFKLFFFAITLVFSSLYSSGAEASKYSGTCIHLFSKLENCTPYKCIHPHPDERKSKEEVYIDVKGKTEEGYCHFVQTTSLGDYMECKYTEDSVALWSKILQYFFKYGMFAINAEDEKAFNRAFKEECSTKPMESTSQDKDEIEPKAKTEPVEEKNK